VDDPRRRRGCECDTKSLVEVVPALIEGTTRVTA
jgi:hypothetical protein